MTLWNAGYSGTIYHCPKCSYTGPVVIELAVDKPEQDTAVQVKAAMSSVSNTLDVIAVLCRLAFVTIGLATWLAQPLSTSGVGFTSALSLGLMIIGGVLILTLPLQLAWRLRHREKMP